LCVTTNNDENADNEETTSHVDVGSKIRLFCFELVVEGLVVVRRCSLCVTYEAGEGKDTTTIPKPGDPSGFETN
jgi:hypothetical protein